ncbi:uncharacterized protein LOC134776279 [Penaeus indicus]|uniref:uncharacterized protein LOC134776279 n=1 Tax=Penaeus indicus TaxID=29960 RepID=UPI00300C6214
MERGSTMAAVRELHKSFSTDKVQKALSMFWVAKPSGVTTSTSYDVSRRMGGAGGPPCCQQGAHHDHLEEGVRRPFADQREIDDTPSIFEFDFADMCPAYLQTRVRLCDARYIKCFAERRRSGTPKCPVYPFDNQSRCQST